MDADERALAAIKIFREYGKFYFSVRSNLTYLNIIACSAFTAFFASPLLREDDGIAYVQQHHWMYVMGCIAYVGVAAWATAICNLLSNSFFNYIRMSMDAEAQLGVDYRPYTKQNWALTFEFIRDKGEIVGPAFQGNVWNVLNGALAAYGMYTLVIVTAVGSGPHSLLDEYLFGGASSVFLVTMFLIFHLSIVEWSLVWVSWIACCAAFYLPLMLGIEGVTVRAPQPAAFISIQVALCVAYAISVLMPRERVR